MSIEDLSQKLDIKLSSLDSKIDNILQNQNKLESSVQTNKTDIGILQQRERNHNLRIIGLKQPVVDKPKPFFTAEYTFSTVIEPILKVALEDKAIPSLPSLLEVVDACHILPSKKDETPTIHIRFQSKLIRDVILSYKSQFFKRSDLRCSIFEDLCPSTRALLQETKARPDVERVWTRNGRIKYTLKDSNAVHSV